MQNAELLNWRVPCAVVSLLFAHAAATAQEAAPTAPPPPPPPAIVGTDAADPAPVPAAEAGIQRPPPTPAWARGLITIPKATLFVMNGISLPMTCRLAGPGGTETPIVLGGGAKIDRQVARDQSDAYRIACGAPADGRTYRLRAGTRNVYLLAPGGVATLRSVDFGPEQ